jgi:mono/diheme cytochrome c family protein
MKLAASRIARLTVGGLLVGMVTSAESISSGAALPTAPEARTTIWARVFTEEQAARAETLYLRFCASCHGLRLDGAPAADQSPSPPIAGEGFLKRWSGQTLQTLHEYIRTMMPRDILDS